VQKRHVFIAFAVFGPKNSVVEKLFEHSETALWRLLVKERPSGSRAPAGILSRSNNNPDDLDWRRQGGAGLRRSSNAH